MRLSDIKPKVTAFLLKEDGKISKKSILKAGIVLGAVALSAAASKAYPLQAANTADGDCPQGVARRVPWPGLEQPAHTNSFHDNSLTLKNVFSKLVATHSHCIEAHTNHVYDYNPPPNDGGSAGNGSPCGW